ncbi:MAG: protoheme IX farnesyltransferase [Planctomycetota bacterium]
MSLEATMTARRLPVDAAAPPETVGGSRHDMSERATDGVGSDDACSESEEDRLAVDHEAQSVGSAFRDWVELTKPRIVAMILVTTVASAWIAMGNQWLPIGMGPLGWLWLLVGTGLVAGSAGAANQIWESDVDQFMPRTASRPIPAERIPIRTAMLATGWALLMGLWILQLRFGVAPALVGLATWLLYVLVYTPMKTRTAWNTTVGAIAGAMPVFIGYTAAGGSLSELAGWMLFGLLAFWQYPHFMAIAWLYRRQYGQAGFQMTTTIDPTGRHAGWQSMVGSVCLILCGLVTCVMPHGDTIFSTASFLASFLVIAAGVPLVLAAWRFSRDPVDQKARKMLRWSLLVLPAVLLVMTLRVAL